MPDASRFFLSCTAALVLCSANGGALRAAEAGGEAIVVDATTEAVIHGALKWLASRQQANGSWTSDGRQKAAIAMTAYTLIAFMAAGNLPEEGEFRRNVAGGMQFLLESIQPDGMLRDTGGNSYMYSNGIATIALAELYGSTRSGAIRPKLEALVKVIVGAQNDEGGWRYQPRPRDADISVTVLQVVGLRAAKNAGLDVPQRTIDAAVRYVRSCHDASRGGFCYQPGRRDPGFARTAAAIYSLQVCGQYDDPLVKTGSQFLFAERGERQWFTYGNFYAAPAQYMIGGDTWKQWYAWARDVLLRSVKRQGDLYYWEPFLDSNREGVGPVYCTAVYAMILAMPYHYLPLYQR